MISQFCGQALFSMIVREVFEWRYDTTVEKMVKSKKSEMENMLFLLSRTFDRSGPHVKRLRKIGLEDEVFDESLMHINCLIRYSTRHAFNNERFFNELPPRLRSRLINVVLKQ